MVDQNVNTKSKEEVDVVVEGQPYQRTYTLGNESEPTATLKEVDDTELNVHTQYLSTDAMRTEGKHHRGTSQQA